MTGSHATSPWSYTALFHLGGGVAEVDPDATAYSRRDVTHELNVNAVWLPHEPVRDAETAWARAFVADLEPHHGGVYLNFLDRDDQDRVPAAFAPAAYRRLVELQRRFDPDRVLQPRRKPAPVPRPNLTSGARVGCAVVGLVGMDLAWSAAPPTG